MIYIESSDADDNNRNDNGNGKGDDNDDDDDVSYVSLQAKIIYANSQTHLCIH